MSNARFRAGMVGAGNICEFHVAAVKKLAPEVELVGITDLNAARAQANAEKWGTTAYKDLDAFRQTVRRSRRLGFRGASVIHPAQVPILNEEFAPAPDEVTSAQKIVAAYDEAVAAGRGSISVDGKMIDVPVVLRAQEVLAIHEAIKEREARNTL